MLGPATSRPRGLCILVCRSLRATQVGDEGKVTLSKAMADWYTAKIQRMANQGVDPTVAMMEGQVEAINESVLTAGKAVKKVTEKAGRASV